MKRTLIISGIIVVAAIIVLIIIGKVTKKKEVTNLYAQSKKGVFEIVVSTTGELQAENSTDIIGPDFTVSRNIRAMDIKITDIVPEGTEVKAGDYVATLDRTSFDNSLKDENEKLNTYQTNVEVKMLDTAVTLSELRDNIKNLRYSVEEAALTVQESKYEPPTTIRQAEISLDKAKRNLDQSIKTYGLKVEQAKTDMRTLKKTLNDQRQRVNDFQTILEKFVIKAPSDGMVIYKRDRTNSKRKVGSSISPWDNVVATLPDMSSMISKTFVNEIDVSKIKAGQKVEIVVDAFPEKSYTGSVVSVANIGEQLPNADAKVFEVQIKLDGSDPILRPSMTTGNKILTKTIDNVVYVPLECVQTGVDSIPYVYKKNGEKQVVVLGESNENNVIIEQGLKEGESLYLSTPAKASRFKVAGENLIAVNKQRAREKQEAELKAREEAAKAAEERQKSMGGEMNPGMNPFQGGNMRGGNFRPGQFNGPRDTARMRKFMQMMRNNPQGMRRDSTRRRNTGTQGGGQGFPQGGPGNAPGGFGPGM